MRRRLGAAAAFVLLAAVATALTLHTHAGSAKVTWYGLVLLGLLAAKMALSLMARPRGKHVGNQAMPGYVTAIVPVYNEDPALLALCLDSLLNQTRKPNAVLIVDDGSDSEACYRLAGGYAHGFAAHGVAYQVLRQENSGKRVALAKGFADTRADAFLCVDSDTVLRHNALEQVLLPMKEAKVTAVTGLVLAGNRRKNTLTRLIDLRYANAFLFERAAYSVLGSVLCCCGSLALYRGDVVRKYLTDFLGQRFLGSPAVFGDDRRLTNYALLEGKVVLQESAVAETVVPERFGHYLRQQIRWNKSFFRESLWVIQHMSVKKPAFALTLVELSSWLAFTTLLLVALVLRPVSTGVVMAGTYTAFIVAMSLARSVRFFEARSGHASFAELAGTFLLAPAYGLLHVFALLPLRLWSLATLAQGSWGTRAQVEVTLSPEVAPEVL